MSSISASCLERLEDIRLIRPCNLKDPYSALVNGPEDGMVNKDISAWNIHFEVNNRRTTRWNECGLDILGRVRTYSAQLIYRVKDLPNNMKGRCKVRAAIAYIETYLLPNFSLQITRGSHGIKLDIGRLFCPCLLYRETLCTFFTCIAGRIEISLDDIVFLVYLGKTFFRIYQDEAVHPVRNMGRDMGSGTMVDI